MFKKHIILVLLPQTVAVAQGFLAPGGIDYFDAPSTPFPSSSLPLEVGALAYALKPSQRVWGAL